MKKLDSLPLPTYHKAKPTFLTNIPPYLLVSKIFMTFGCFCRLVGIIPVSVNQDGTSSFKLISKPVIHTICYIAIFAGTSSIYIPEYVRQSAKFKGDAAYYISDNLFIGGQFIGVVFTIMIIPQMAKGVVQVWNGLIGVIEFMAIRNHTDLYVEPYIRSRVGLLIHSIYVIIYAVICWRDFTARLTLKDVKEAEPLKYWTNSFLLVVFFICMFIHLFPCMICKMFTVVISKSYIGLKLVLQEERAKVIDAEKNKKFEQQIYEIIEMYDKLRILAKQLGYGLGLFLLVEMVVMMTSVLLNAFTMLSGFEHRDAYSTAFCFISYSALLIMLTEGGEQLKRVGQDCMEEIRHAVYSIQNVDPVLMHKIAIMQRPKISAAGFFSVDRKLAVAMATTFATYFVVIIQFKLNSQALNEAQA